jgi:hypothetical protein
MTTATCRDVATGCRADTNGAFGRSRSESRTCGFTRDETDDDHLETTAPPVADQGHRRVHADGKEGGPLQGERHLADLRAKSGLTTEHLIYVGRAAGWLAVPSLELYEPLLTSRTRLPGAAAMRPHSTASS